MKVAKTRLMASSPIPHWRNWPARAGTFAPLNGPKQP